MPRDRPKQPAFEILPFNVDFGSLTVQVPTPYV